MFKYFGKDSFFFGVIIGILFSTIAYYTYVNHDQMMGGYEAMQVKLSPPRLQLILLVPMLILFRFMMVKWDMMKTGQGLFFTIFIFIILFFFNLRYKFF